MAAKGLHKIAKARMRAALVQFLCQITGMSRRKDRRRLSKYAEKLRATISYRLSSDEFQTILRMSDGGGIGRTETFAKFYATQYSIATREVAAIARAEGCENLFKMNEVFLFDVAFEAAVGSAYGDGVAEGAMSEARRMAREEMNSRGGPDNPGPALFVGVGHIADLDLGEDGEVMEAAVDVTAYEECCVIRDPATGAFVDYFRWAKVGEYRLNLDGPEQNLFVAYKAHRVLCVPASQWEAVVTERGMSPMKFPH